MTKAEQEWIVGMLHLMTNAVSLEQAYFPKISLTNDLAIVMNKNTYAMVDAYCSTYLRVGSVSSPRLFGIPIEIDSTIKDKHVRLVHKEIRFEFAPEMI